MFRPGQESSNSDDSNWWSSWLNSAKEKSVSALNATKRDLAEFVNVLGKDTKVAVSGASQNVKSIIEGNEPAKNGSPTTRSKVSPPTMEPPSAPYDRSQAQLFAVQNSADTYLQEPKSKSLIYTCYHTQYILSFLCVMAKFAKLFICS